MAHKNASNWSPYKARQKSKKKGGGPGQGLSNQAPGQRHRKPGEQYSFHEADDRIYDVFRNHGFSDYPHEKRRQLTRFYELLMANQNEQNFTRLLTIRDVAIKHFIDSLIVAKLT